MIWFIKIVLVLFVVFVGRSVTDFVLHWPTWIGWVSTIIVSLAVGRLVDRAYGRNVYKP